MHSFVISKNVKWCHLIWPTRYFIILLNTMVEETMFTILAFPILTWCPAEGYRKRRSAPPCGPLRLRKDFTLLLIYTYKCTKFG